MGVGCGDKFVLLSAYSKIDYKNCVCGVFPVYVTVYLSHKFCRSDFKNITVVICLSKIYSHLAMHALSWTFAAADVLHRFYNHNVNFF